MKKNVLLFAMLAMLSFSVNSENVFIKGDFNSWSDSNPLTGSGDYFTHTFQYTGTSGWEQFKIHGQEWFGRSSAPVAINTEKITLYSTDGSNVYQELLNNKYYTLKTDTFVDNGGSGFKRDLIIFQTDATPVEVVSVIDDGATASTTLTISITLDADYTQDTLYLRYTNDEWASSTIVKALKTADMSYEVILSSLAGNDVISYYVLTSAVSQAVLESDPGFYALNMDNNSGANYSFTVPTATQLISNSPSVFNVNAFNGQLQMEVSSEANQPLSVSIVNLVGQAYGSYSMQLEVGNNTFTLPQTLNNGIYVLQVQMDSQRIVKKIAIQ